MYCVFQGRQRESENAAIWEAFYRKWAEKFRQNADLNRRLLAKLTNQPVDIASKKMS